MVAALIAAVLPGATTQPPPLPFLSPAFGDHMVLQRDRPNTLWGWAKPGSTVTIRIANRAATGTAAGDGKWTARIKPPPVGGPYTVTIEGDQKVELQDVLVGDVWICSGQSNMEQGIGMCVNGPTEIAAANYPNIRLAMVSKSPSFLPRQAAPVAWTPCSPETIARGGWGGFSGVAYFFGRELHKRLGVPIGLVQTCWGGTIIEAWASRGAVESQGDFGPRLAQVDQAVRDGKPADNPNVPAVLYNGMIQPIAPLAIKGAIWYQGESNASRAYQYRELMPMLVTDWRRAFEQPKLPFFLVQLANFTGRLPEPAESDWAELREAQFLATKRLRNVGIATAIDIGEANDIHPRNKQDVGARLALSALKIAYGQDVVHSGPTYRSMEIEGGAIRIRFDHTEGGLRRTSAVLKGFAIAGKDRKFVWADVWMDGKTLVVSSPRVPEPVAVRYAWANNPETSIANGAGLPALPFRTDDWPGVTVGRK